MILNNELERIWKEVSMLAFNRRDCECYEESKQIHYNIKMDLREIEWDGMDWIDMAQDREQRKVIVNTVMNLRVP
jgi:hypothetical protein